MTGTSGNTIDDDRGKALFAHTDQPEPEGKYGTIIPRLPHPTPATDVIAMTTHAHPRDLHAHDAHGDGDHESIHDHGQPDGGDHGHGGHHRGHHNGHGHEDMLEVEQAFERIIAHFSPLDAVELPVLECLGMVLAEDVSSPLNLPPLANSAMDGYAVLNEDIAAANDVAPTLSVISVVAAGQVSDRTITRGNAIRIMTGAPVPNGADTVVPFEETDELERRGAGTPLDEIVIRKALPLGSNVRPAGEDVRAGELVLTAGTVVRRRKPECWRRWAWPPRE